MDDGDDPLSWTDERVEARVRLDGLQALMDRECVSSALRARVAQWVVDRLDPATVRKCPSRVTVEGRQLGPEEISEWLVRRREGRSDPEPE